MFTLTAFDPNLSPLVKIIIIVLIINHNYPIIIVNPHIGTESDTKADPKEYGSIPMDENKNVKDHTSNAKSIWKICSGLSFFKEFSHPSSTENTI